MMMLDTLALRCYPNSSDGKYIDGFWISGVSLLSLLSLQSDDWLPVFSVYEPIFAKNIAKQFLHILPSDLPNQGCPLFVCPCGDVGCGVISVQVVFADKTVFWQDFLWENTQDSHHLLDYPLVFQFDKQQYFQVFDEICRY